MPINFSPLAVAIPSAFILNPSRRIRRLSPRPPAPVPTPALHAPLQLIMDAAHSANPATISMNEHDVPFVNLSIAVFQQDFDSTAHPASFPGNPFHWALALEELNTWTAISRLSMRNVVDCGSNRGSSSSDEETDISFKPPPSPSPPFLSSSSPSPLSSSSPSPSPPPRSGGDVSPRLGTAPVNLYYILNTGGIEWETSCRTGLSLDSIPSYLGSVDVARIRGVDLKDLDEFLMQFTAENPRPGGELLSSSYSFFFFLPSFVSISSLFVFVLVIIPVNDEPRSHFSILLLL